MIGATKLGELILTEQGEVKPPIIENAFCHEDLAVKVVTLTPFSKGFYIGSDKGDMAMWVRYEENNSSSGKQGAYDFIRRWTPPATKKQQVIGMKTNTNGDQIAVALSNNNIGIVQYKSIGLNEDMT